MAQPPDVIAWPWPEADAALRAAGWQPAVRRTMWREAPEGALRVLAVRPGPAPAVEVILGCFAAGLRAQDVAGPKAGDAS